MIWLVESDRRGREGGGGDTAAFLHRRCPFAIEKKKNVNVSWFQKSENESIHWLKLSWKWLCAAFGGVPYPNIQAVQHWWPQFRTRFIISSVWMDSSDPNRVGFNLTRDAGNWFWCQVWVERVLNCGTSDWNNGTIELDLVSLKNCLWISLLVDYNFSKMTFAIKMNIWITSTHR